MKSFWSDRSGNYGVVVAIAALPLLLSVGLATDYSRHVAAHRHLQELADGASLALASSKETNKTKLQEMADKFIISNRSGTRLENVRIASLKAGNDWVDLKLQGDIPTTFMNLANIQTLDVRASALAERAVTGSVEVALVLDNTDSMNVDNKIGALKEAADNLVEELFDAEDAEVRIGLVPYAEQINVGMHNRKASWISVPENYTTKKTTTTGGYWYQPKKRTDECKRWREAGSRMVEKDGVWVEERWGRSCAEWVMAEEGPKKWVPKKTKTTTMHYQWHGCIGARISGSKLVLDDQSPSVKYPGLLSTGGANRRKCLTEILPLTDKENIVRKAVKDMITSRPGYTPQTYIPGGVIWGLNLLSPTAPLDEGAAYDLANRKPRKVMVVMTDGLNTRRVNMSNGDYAPANALQRLQTNADTKTVCDYAKAQKIEIFTVAFKVDDPVAKAMLLDCATSSGHYYDASDPDKLLAAFAGIGQSLRQVRLAR
jgi:Flp pilus assembly protein TadG